MNGDCACHEPHARRRIVLTGGPGAGKTAVLELVRRSFCKHIRVLPEAAGILFGGGFPREAAEASRKAAQRAIYHVQRQLELLTGDNGGPPAILLCDRGTLDGLAYWPGEPDELLREVGTDRAAELARYDVVIHLRTPTLALGYNQTNGLRTESAVVAREIDARIEEAWRRHPRRFVVESDADFLVKASRALEILQAELPPCCRSHFSASLLARPDRDSRSEPGTG